MPETIFGDRLHQARVLRQRKLADLADMLECSVPTLSKWERSREIDFSSSQLDRVTENQDSPHSSSSRGPHHLCQIAISSLKHQRPRLNVKLAG